VGIQSVKTELALTTREREGGSTHREWDLLVAGGGGGGGGGLKRKWLRSEPNCPGGSESEFTPLVARLEGCFLGGKV